jgi:hypothetical protein
MTAIPDPSVPEEGAEAAERTAAADGAEEDFRPQTFQPTRKDRLRPLELLGLSAGMALFVGLIVLLSTREVVLSLVAFGIAFIVVLVAVAMFMLTFKPDDAEIRDIDEQDRGAHS